MTRTVYLGKTPKKFKDLYSTLLRVQKEAIKMLKPGISSRSIDQMIRNELGEELASKFIHGTGPG
jgi:Xaa-Pro aminopeptidase